MLTIRPATMGDARDLFEWRNDPLTRAMSRNTEAVEWADHVNWLSRSLESVERRLLMIESNGRPVATVRFDQGDETEVSLTVAPR